MVQSAFKPNELGTKNIDKSSYVITSNIDQSKKVKSSNIDQSNSVVSSNIDAGFGLFNNDEQTNHGSDHDRLDRYFNCNVIWRNLKLP